MKNIRRTICAALAALSIVAAPAVVSNYNGGNSAGYAITASAAKDREEIRVEIINGWRYEFKYIYFKKYTGDSCSIVDALKNIGENSSYNYRSRIAALNGISNYTGTATQNTKMLNLLKKGKLIKNKILVGTPHRV